MASRVLRMKNNLRLATLHARRCEHKNTSHTHTPVHNDCSSETYFSGCTRNTLRLPDCSPGLGNVLFNAAGRRRSRLVTARRNVKLSETSEKYWLGIGKLTARRVTTRHQSSYETYVRQTHRVYASYLSTHVRVHTYLVSARHLVWNV